MRPTWMHEDYDNVKYQIEQKILALGLQNVKAIDCVNILSNGD